MSVDNYRKCAKCGKTRAEDMSVTFHRFPQPGDKNITKARAWAKYCWPDEEWSSVDFLQSLYTRHKVLCGRHFDSSQFYDNKRQKLSKFAIPESISIEELCENIPDHDTQQSKEYPFRKPQKISENIQAEPQEHGTREVMEISDPTEYKQDTQQSKECPFRKPLSEIQNIQAEPQEHGTREVMETSDSTEHKQFQNVSVNTSNAPVLPISPSTSKSKSAKKYSGILNKINVSKVSDMTPREAKLYKICHKKTKEIIRLRKQIKMKKKTNIIKTISEDENVQKLSNMNISNSFVALLQSQLKNCPKKLRGRRYNLEQKIMALVIYKKSPACYKLLRRMFALPCQSSLNKLLNRVPLQPGINRHIFMALSQLADKQTDDDNICILSFDEMTIRKHLFYDTKLDQIQGFQDQGSHGRCNIVASKALVFMLAGLRKKWKQPIAFYFSHSINAERMTAILKEILTECFNSNMNVVATVCDLSTVNIKVLKTLGASTTKPFFVHCNREIVAILDPPHLLKCTRNLFMKHNVECPSDLKCNDMTIKGIAKWSHIEEFYEMEKNNPNFVYAPSLTNHHLHPNVKDKMRVKLASQILSHSVTGGILAKIASNELPVEAIATATFTKVFDQLFDAVNADSQDLRRGKKISTNVTKRSPHLALFREMKTFISAMKYIGSKTNPPSQEGWIHTINAIEKLWIILQSKNLNSLATRRLNQDPLENCFGCIRYNCGSNNNPTISQFIAGIKTAIITNLRHTGQKKNCEDDSAILANNLTSFLTADCSSSNVADAKTYFNEEEIISFLADAVEAVEGATSEGQACGYVCGFIFKKLKNNNCIDCQKAFLTQREEPMHIFTSLKEYDLNKKSLNYVNKDVVQCVETLATIINKYLETNAWKTQIRENVMANLVNIDFNYLLKCANHFENNVHHIKKSTFLICIKRYIVLKNRDMEEEEKKKSIERKMRILKNK